MIFCPIFGIPKSLSYRFSPFAMSACRAYSFRYLISTKSEHTAFHRPNERTIPSMHIFSNFILWEVITAWSAGFTTEPPGNMRLHGGTNRIHFSRKTTITWNESWFRITGFKYLSKTICECMQHLQEPRTVDVFDVGTKIRTSQLQPASSSFSGFKAASVGTNTEIKLPLSDCFPSLEGAPHTHTLFLICAVRKCIQNNSDSMLVSIFAKSVSGWFRCEAACFRVVPPWSRHFRPW